MKKIETLAVIIIVLCVLSNISPIASTFIGAKFFGDETYGKFNLSIHLMATLTWLTSQLLYGFSKLHERRKMLLHALGFFSVFSLVWSHRCYSIYLNSTKPSNLKKHSPKQH